MIFESVRALVLCCTVLYVWRAGRGRFEAGHKGWKLIIAGLGLLLFGSLLDITDNFERLNRFVVIGDTNTKAFLEKFVGFLGGFVVLAWGLFLWMPRVAGLSAEAIERQSAEKVLRVSEAALSKAERLARIGTWRWDVSNNKLISCSDEYARIHGVSLEEAPALLAARLERVIHPDDCERVEAEFKRYAEQARTTTKRSTASSGRMARRAACSRSARLFSVAMAGLWSRSERFKT